MIKNFKRIWADNGDWISIHYTGTGSTHSSVVRSTANRGIAGILDHGYKSVARAWNQYFEDDLR